MLWHPADLLICIGLKDPSITAIYNAVLEGWARFLCFLDEDVIPYIGSTSVTLYSYRLHYSTMNLVATGTYEMLLQLLLQDTTPLQLGDLLQNRTILEMLEVFRLQVF